MATNFKRNLLPVSFLLAYGNEKILVRIICQDEALTKNMNISRTLMKVGLQY